MSAKKLKHAPISAAAVLRSSNKPFKLLQPANLMNRGNLLSVLLFALLLASPFALAAELFDPAEKFEGSFGVNPEKIPASSDEIRASYLKQEWSGFLKENKYLGPPTRVADAILTFLNPVFKLVLGVPYVLSWLFIFALLCWFTLFYFVYPPMSAMLQSKPLAILSATIIASLAGLSGVIRRAADMLNTIVTERWLLYVSLLLALLIAFILHLVGKNIKAAIKQAKESSAKEQEKQDRAVLHVDAEAAKKDLESRDTS